jgi:3'-phosphoadenosine 5'-phosphosulfate sulfotransferase (PAPS reductase)/FAD synthetase
MTDLPMDAFDRLRRAFGRHKRALLAFSGGKDSLACLHLLSDYWNRITVAWVDTGDAFPETLAQMEGVARIVPDFVRIPSDQPAQIARAGWPVEVVPVDRTEYGRLVGGHHKQLFQPYVTCCAENIWAPMHQAVQQLGATLVIRGTKKSDKRRAPVESGSVIDGVEYFNPLEDWTDADVVGYLSEVKISLPPNYDDMNTSLDCRMCTAYLHENAGKVRYMRRRHPEHAEELGRRITEIRDVLREELRHVEGCIQ